MALTKKEPFAKRKKEGGGRIELPRTKGKKSSKRKKITSASSHKRKVP